MDRKEGEPWMKVNLSCASELKQNICVCVCVCVCVFVYVYLCIYTCVSYLCMCICACVLVYLYLCICTSESERRGAL